MTIHTSDINSNIFDLSYQQVSSYLKRHGWVHEKTLDSIDIYSFEYSDSTCRVLLPHDDKSEEYKHRLADILLILQMLQSPSLLDINRQIKKFCLDYSTQVQIHE